MSRTEQLFQSSPLFLSTAQSIPSCQPASEFSFESANLLTLLNDMFCIFRRTIIGQFIIRSMQNQLEILIASTNKIALSLSLKQHSINEDLIRSEGRSAYGRSQFIQPQRFPIQAIILEVPVGSMVTIIQTRSKVYAMQLFEWWIQVNISNQGIKLAQLFQRKSKLHLETFLQPT